MNQKMSKLLFIDPFDKNVSITQAYFYKVY